MVTGKKKTDESSKEDQVEVPMARGAFATSSDHDAVAFGRMMGSFGARTNLIRKQVGYEPNTLEEFFNDFDDDNFLSEGDEEDFVDKTRDKNISSTPSSPLPQHPATPSSGEKYEAISYRKPVSHPYHSKFDSMTTPAPRNSVTWPKESVRTVTARDWTPAPTGSGGFGDWVGNMVDRFPSDQADVLPKFVTNNYRSRLRKKEQGKKYAHHFGHAMKEDDLQFRVPVPPLPPKEFMDRPHPDFPEVEELNPFIDDFTPFGAQKDSPRGGRPISPGRRPPSPDNNNDRRSKHRDRAYKFDAFQPTTAPPSGRPPSPPTTSPYSYVVITNKDGKPQYVPNPNADLYESVRTLSKAPDSIRNQLDYDDYRDDVGDAARGRDPDAKDGRPTAPDDTGARFGNNAGGSDDFAGGHHFFDDFSAFDGANNNSPRGGRPISPGRRPQSPGPLLPPSRDSRRQRIRQRRPPPPPQYEQYGRDPPLRPGPHPLPQPLLSAPLKPLIPIRGFGVTQRPFRFRGRGGFRGRGRGRGRLPPTLGGGPKFTSLRDHHEDFYDYQDYGDGGKDVLNREEEEKGFDYDNFLNDYETSYPKQQFNYNDAYRDRGRRYPPRRPHSRPISPPPRSQHGTRYNDFDYDFPAEVYEGPMKAVDYQPTVKRPPRHQDEYDDYEAEALPNPAALVAQKPPLAADDNRFRDDTNPQRPSKDYSTLYREKLKRLREFNNRNRHKERPPRGPSPTRTIFGRDPGGPGGFSDYAFGDLKGGKAKSPEEGYNTDFVAKEPGHDPGYEPSYSPQLSQGKEPGYNPGFVESDKVGGEPGFNKNFFESDGGGGGGGEPGFNKNFFEAEGGGGGADSFNRGFFDGGGGGADSYDPMFGDAVPFRRIDDDEKEVRRKKRPKKKSPFLDRTFKKSKPINKQLTPDAEFTAPAALPEPARLKSRFRGRKRVPMRDGANGARFPRRKFMRRLNYNRGIRRNGGGGGPVRRKRNRRNKVGGCARCGRALVARNSIAAASDNSVRQMRPPRSNGGPVIASATGVVNATAAAPTSSSLRPEMMAVEALSGMVSALSVVAAATAARGRKGAAEKYGNTDAGEAELADTILRGIQEVAQKFESSKDR